MHSSSERVKQTLYRVKLQINLKYDFFSQGKNVSKLLCLINWASWSEPLAYAIYLSHIMIINKRTYNGKNTAVLSPRPLLYVQQFLIHCHLYSPHRQPTEANGFLSNIQFLHTTILCLVFSQLVISNVDLFNYNRFKFTIFKYA